MKPSRMRLPAVVSTPSVQNRSLIASGMPSSGRASPRGEPRVGLRRHRQRALGRLGDEGVQRARPPRSRRHAPRQLARREAFARRPSRASARVRSVARSLDHLGHDEKVVLALAARWRGCPPAGRHRSPCPRDWRAASRPRWSSAGCPRVDLARAARSSPGCARAPPPAAPARPRARRSGRARDARDGGLIERHLPWSPRAMVLETGAAAIRLRSAEARGNAIGWPQTA